MANKEDEYKKLRSYLNRSIRGKNTEAILRSLATGPTHLINNVEAVNDSLYIVSAKEKYLDQRLGDKGVTRPPEVGLSDEVFREIGIEITNRKQVRDLIHQLLRILYGEIFTRATAASYEVEPFFLEEGDSLIVSFDDSNPVEIVFTSDQFANINTATSQEIADAITKSIRKTGRTGSAFARQDDGQTKVVLISSTDGPSSSVKVLGGKAQNALKFDKIRETSADTTTQWALTQTAGGAIRATWTGGANPSIGLVKIGDYVNIYGTAFDPANRGTFTITNVQGGDLVNKSYIEFENPNGIPTGTSNCVGGNGNEKNPTECSLNGGTWNSSVIQGSDDAILFFNPKKLLLSSNSRYAAAFQTSPRTIEIFLPATTKVVRRNRQGAAHIYGDSTLSTTDQFGPYSYDTTAGYTIGEEFTTTKEKLDVSSDAILSVNDASVFPDDVGYIMVGLGTSHQEGPIPYISRPSDDTIRINPSYKFKKEHPIGTDVSLVSSLFSPSPNKNGTDIPFYLTDSVAGRTYAQNLIKEIVATGIIVVIYVLYPNDEGLGKWNDETNSEKYYIWGTLEDL